MSDLFHSLSLSLLLLPFLFISMAAQFNYSTYPSCPSYNCGNINISYPFWRIGSEPSTQFCGYPGFGINCSKDGDQQDIPTINLGNDSYYIQNIFYGDQILEFPYTLYEPKTIVLVDYDVSATVPIVDCPMVRHNISIGTLPFLFTDQNVNLRVHFNCTGVPPFAHEIPCLSSASSKSCVNKVNSEPANFSWDEYSCDDDAVVATVLDELGPERLLGIEFIEALRGGFELAWERMGNCKKCETSFGRCGYNSNTTELMCFCSGGTTTLGHCEGSGVWVKIMILGILSAISLSIVLMCICSMKSSLRSNCVVLSNHPTADENSIEAFVIQYGSLSAKRYTYADINDMTNSFEVKLGQGGFGTVFKGKLSDGRLVAVKVLNSSKASGQEFINEVASIGRTSHVNIVTLLGFCFEHQKGALLYEFMPNGSLEKFIYGRVCPNTSKPIGVDKLYEIALGIARGLDYLHRGCNTRILHLDIKPHNILLDEDFCPKIADFGLAKLYSRKDSIVSMLEARGTIGYIAPEVVNRNFGGVSHKSDVYSYGMLILEIVGGRKNVDAGVGSGHTSEIYFPHWIYNRLKKDEILLDGLTTIEENDYARKMTIVGLWCIQTDPKQRPSINGVIEMLEGNMESLEIPPKPFFSSLPRSQATTCNTSEDVSMDHCSIKEV